MTTPASLAKKMTKELAKDTKLESFAIVLIGWETTEPNRIHSSCEEFVKLLRKLKEEKKIDGSRVESILREG